MLNIALEQLFFTNAEAATKVKTKKTGTVSARKTVTIKNDASSEIADGNNIDVKIQGVDDGQGVSLYVDGGSDENVTIPDTGIIYKTQAKIAVPSSYFLDLRGMYVDSDDQRYTADVAVLHDIDGNTIFSAHDTLNTHTHTTNPTNTQHTHHTTHTHTHKHITQHTHNAQHTHIHTLRTVVLTVVRIHHQAYRDWETDRKSTRLNSSHITRSRMPSSA